jgi:hypothetical protein
MRRTHEVKSKIAGGGLVIREDKSSEIEFAIL